MDDQRRKIDIFNERWHLINMSMHKKMKAAVRSHIREYGLTPNEMEILIFLAHSPHDTAREIVRHKGFSRSLVSKTVDALMRNGYVEAHTDEADRRVVHLLLTGKGKEIIGKLDQVAEMVKLRLFEGISVEEIDRVVDIVQKMLDNFERIEEQMTTETEENE